MKTLFAEKKLGVQLLIEKSSLIEPSVMEKQQAMTIDEKKDGTLYIEGPFGIYDKLNLNRRRYSKNVMEKSIDLYNTNYVKAKRAVSELGHPENSDVNLDRVSHVITEPLYLKENIVYGRAKVLDQFPMGKILHSYLKEGLVLGISTRGLGEVVEQEFEDGETQLKETIYDVSDFVLSAFDAVWEPSIGQFVSAISEGKSFDDASKHLTEQMKKLDFYKLVEILHG